MKTKKLIVDFKFVKHTGAFATNENQENCEKVINYLKENKINYNIETKSIGYSQWVTASISLKHCAKIYELINKEEDDKPSFMIYR